MHIWGTSSAGWGHVSPGRGPRRPGAPEGHHGQAHPPGGGPVPSAVSVVYRHAVDGRREGEGEEVQLGGEHFDSEGCGLSGK